MDLSRVALIRNANHENLIDANSLEEIIINLGFRPPNISKRQRLANMAIPEPIF